MYVVLVVREIDNLWTFVAKHSSFVFFAQERGRRRRDSGHAVACSIHSSLPWTLKRTCTLHAPPVRSLSTSSKAKHFS